MESLLQTRAAGTHLLYVEFEFSPDLSESSCSQVKDSFSAAISGKKHEVEILKGDAVHITWFKALDDRLHQVYYTTCRFADTYVQQLTKGLTRKALRRALEEHSISKDKASVMCMPVK